MHRLTSSHVLRQFTVRTARYIREENQDLVLPITGAEGDGKSTLALWLALLFDRDFNHEVLPERISWDSQTHQRLVNQAPRYKPVILDEGEGILGQDHMTSENRSFKKFLYRCRKQNVIQLIITPNWQAFSRVLKDWRARRRIQLDGKGKGRLLQKSQDGDGWGKVFSFNFPSLEGTKLWDAYSELADLGAEGKDPHNADTATTEDDGPTLEDYVRDYATELEPLAEIARREAVTEDGEPWEPSSA